MIKAYYSLTKPGMVRGNTILAAAGFLFASQGHVDLRLLVSLLAGLALVIASGCVFNNYIDRNIDRLMKRTEKRALAAGDISKSGVIVFGTLLGLTGLSLLFFYVNILTACFALAGFVFYVILYSPMKHRSEHAALVGSVAGAVPIVAGYCAVTNRFDTAAFILFLMLVFWQMAHFYAISLYRKDEYAAASIPVFSVKNSARKTKIHIACYIFAFIVASLTLYGRGTAGNFYLAAVAVLCVGWVALSLVGFKKTQNDARWARRMFLYSLVVILTLAVTLAV